ncbi:hypothetical protein TrCOL_g1145 [Triparma columacea]|uniref:Uncharacterized protein n=1 Tax=Triparma columacea TaxID=722753 RepID=A0A9W7G7G8_9STRA|nr:hypothetical protein TrCOL_g1145 [Triparma columacea]
MKDSTQTAITVTSIAANHGAVFFWILGLLGFNEWRFTQWHDGDYYYLAAALCWGISNFAVTYEFFVQRREGREKMIGSTNAL